MDVAREQVTALKKHNEDLKVKSKLDLKILAKEVKSLRSSQSELRQEIVRLTKEKVEAEVLLIYHVCFSYFHSKGFCGFNSCAQNHELVQKLDATDVEESSS